MRLTERWLLQRLKAGDRKACTTLIDQHYQHVYCYLEGLTRDPDRAADLTQETYAKAWQALPGFRGTASFRTWLFSIARNEFLLELRRSGRAHQVAAYQDFELIADPAPVADETLSAGDLRRRVSALVQRLPSHYRETISLHYYARMSLREVAQVLGVPPGTAKSRLSKALLLLQQQLETEEMSHADQGSGESAARGNAHTGAC